MERRGMETHQTERLTKAKAEIFKRAFALYKKYIGKGLEVPTEEAKTLQKITLESLVERTPIEDSEENGERRGKRRIVRTAEGKFVEDKSPFDYFRQDIGSAALNGEIKLGGKDIGVEVFCLIFGHEDAVTFRAVSLLAKEVGYPVYYTITRMFVFYQFISNKVMLGKELSSTAQAALSRLESFLSTKGDDATRERIFIEQEVRAQLGLQKEIEWKVGQGLTPEQIRAEMVSNIKEAARLWDKFRSVDIHKAHPLVGRILNLVAENRVLKQLEKTGQVGEHFPSVPPSLLANRARAAAHEKMASEIYRQAEPLPPNSFEHQALIRRAKEYEETAAQLWQAGQVTSNQEAVHV